MGQSESHHPQYDAALAVFTATEQNNISKLFQTIAGVNPVSFTEDQLQAYLKGKLPKPLVSHLHIQLSNVLYEEQHGQGGHSKPYNTYVSKEAFVVGLSHVLKGTLTERARVYLRLATVKEFATTDDLVQLMIQLLNSYMTMMTETEQFKSWNMKYEEEANRNLAMFLMDELIHDGQDQYFEYDLERWLLRSAFVTHVLEYVFNKCFPVSQVPEVERKTSEPDIDKKTEDAHVKVQPKIPHCIGVDWSKMSTVLTLTNLILLNHSIPQSINKRWRLLFSSNLHGQSFATMLKLIMNKGPTLLVIKDKDGAIFGGFAPESWSLNANYYGSTTCFLFTLFPKVGRYFPTGYNENYMYLNQMQQTLPNGLGFGGQLRYFGLWLDSEFGIGSSKAEPKCTTFGSPQLSGKSDFQIDTVEVWHVGPDKEEEEEAKTSILDKDPAAKALLSLAGKEMVSEGLRETDATAHTPSDKALHTEHGM